ncbi:MAG: STAS domain-containing protein [Fibrobacter sp.]|nr:STAS domain-containing protein [Fibrobacter sp.]
MKIDIGQHGAYQILKIEEDLNVISDLSELRFLINGYLHQGKRHIAISFTGASYIYSGALAVLIDIFKQVKEKDGELCILEPHPEILSIFHALHLDQFLPIYTSIEKLPMLGDQG